MSPSLRADRLDALVPTLLTRGREIILETCEVTSCIVATRVAIEVLKIHGIRARGQAMRVEAMNAAAIWDVKMGVPVPSPESYIVATEGTGAFDPGDNSWDGHLVAIFTDAKGEVLLDLSADQFARPGKGIHAEPLALRLNGGFPVGYVWENGSCLAYDPVKSRGYRQSSNWADREKWGPIYDRIMEEIR